jgi:hypothetical protein
MISTRRRVEYASGYLELGLTAAAAEELAAIDRAEEDRPEVLRVRTEYLMQAREWVRLVKVATDMAGRLPDEEAGWIAWAYALRELNRIGEARSVLLTARPAGCCTTIWPATPACWGSARRRCGDSAARSG